MIQRKIVQFQGEILQHGAASLSVCWVCGREREREREMYAVRDKSQTICGVVSERTLLSEKRLPLSHYLQLPLASNSPQLST